MFCKILYLLWFHSQRCVKGLSQELPNFAWTAFNYWIWILWFTNTWHFKEREFKICSFFSTSILVTMLFSYHSDTSLDITSVIKAMQITFKAHCRKCLHSTSNCALVLKFQAGDWLSKWCECCFISCCWVASWERGRFWTTTPQKHFS